MEKSFFSYRSDLRVEENVWAELYRRNSLAERYRVVLMQIFVAIEFSTVDINTGGWPLRSFKALQSQVLLYRSTHITFRDSHPPTHK